MAIIIKAKYSDRLIFKIKKAIVANEIDAWICDDDGDFTYESQPWRFQAWIRPIIKDEHTIIFAIVGRNDQKLTTLAYAIYHSRFIEMVLALFDYECTEIYVTPFASDSDYLGGNNNQ